MVIDLNCDLGESFGAYVIGQDELMMPYITSANVACGFHGGDPSVMRKTVELCLEHGVAIGAHPGYCDLLGFGRREMKLHPQEIYDMMIYQVGALKAFVEVAGGRLHHVKPHGALYNMAARDRELAAQIARSIADVDQSIILYGLSGSLLIEEGRKAGLTCAHEVFADRTYRQDGTLTPRTQANALLETVEEAVAQGVELAEKREVVTSSGERIPMQVDTICVHGDGSHALDFVKTLRKAFEAKGIEVRPYESI